MKNIIVTLFAITTITSLLSISCSKERSCEGCAIVNKPPVAIAGNDELVLLPKDNVLLNGSASYDPDGKITEWRWTKIAGPALFIINQPDSAKTMIESLVQGTYLFELMVKDDKGASAKDTVQVTVQPNGSNNKPPLACAGSDQTISLPVDRVLLNGSCSTDPDNNITSYLWTMISGPSPAVITNSNAVQTQATKLTEGKYLFQLKVTDAEGLFSLDTVQITVINPSPVDIYIAGSENGIAVYWKNGQRMPLSHGRGESAASSIAVVGNDVYVAGTEGDFFMYGNNIAKYWKNGQEVLLTGPVGAGANSIAVAGSDVYVAGWEIRGTAEAAVYWKNGQKFFLTDGKAWAEATCIVVVNGDVYISGFENGVAKYWKNGQEVILTDGTNQAYTSSIAVAGNDVYVAGSESNGKGHVAKYWKNGQAITLTDGTAVAASATAIAVSGTDVYVAGWEGDFVGRVGGTGAVAKYWKNGQAVTLTNGSTYVYTSGIALNGTDFYIAGSDMVSGGSSAQYWINGQTTPITLSTNGGAGGIVVVKR